MSGYSIMSYENKFVLYYKRNLLQIYDTWDEADFEQQRLMHTQAELTAKAHAFFAQAIKEQAQLYGKVAV